MQVIGELSPCRISGISSSGTVWKCLAWDQRGFGFPSFWLANNAEPEMVVTKDLGGFPFDEKGNGSNGLSHGNQITSINKGHHQFYHLSWQKVSISNLESRNGVDTVAESGWFSVFWISVFCKVFSTIPLSEASVSSGSVSMPTGAEPEPKINKELSQLTTGMLITTQNYQNASRNSIGQIDSRFDGSHWKLTILSTESILAPFTSTANGATNTPLQKKTTICNSCYNWNCKHTR